MKTILINSCACYGSNDLHECYCNLKTNNMEAKEKAKELFNKYKPICAGYNGGQSNKYFTKQAAFIAVNEICEAIHYHYDDSTDIEWKYWQQVKREIDNL